MKNALLNQLSAIRRTIHRYPELGNQEFKTTDLVEKILKKSGIPVKRITRTGTIGLLAGKKKGQGKTRTIAIRADIDALPVQEKTGTPYASRRPGIMHACGHDGNTTMALGAAMLLAERRDEFAGNVKFIFQPNEESSGGARSLIEAGVLKNPDVDAICGIHVSPWLPSGVLGLKRNEMMAAVDQFTIEIIGEGGHGAYPHLATDAIVAAAAVVDAFQTIVSRETDPLDHVVVTIGTIAGGERYNIICNKVTMTGTVRTLNGKVHDRVRKLMEKKLKYITAAYGARYTFGFEELGSALVNSDSILDLCRASGEAVVGKIRFLEKPSMGGEDFAEYLADVPGCFVYLGTGDHYRYPWHHEKFDLDERVLPRGAAFLADVAIRFLGQE